MFLLKAYDDDHHLHRSKTKLAMIATNYCMIILHVIIMFNLDCTIYCYCCYFRVIIEPRSIKKYTK